MSVEFVDTNVVLYSLSDDVTKRRQALAILANQPVLLLQVLNEAANIMRRKHYDSLIIAAALESGCVTLYSEDLQHGQVLDQRLTIINPFKPKIP